MKIKDKKFIVYKHTNKLNGKVYIGITCNSPKERWGKGVGYCNQLVFYRAIKKYGWDGFNHEILYKGLDNDDAFKIESELISYYKSLRMSYNMSGGYDDTPDTSRPIDVYDLKKNYIGSYKSIHEAALKLNIAETGLCTALNDDTRFHFHGYVPVDKGTYPDYTLWDNLKRKTRRVSQYTKNGEFIRTFDSMWEAAQSTNTWVGSMGNCCNGKQRTANGFIWKYKDD